VPWANILAPQHGFRVEVTCTKSKIYHSGAAVERIERAITDVLKISPSVESDLTVMARIDHDICTLSIDTSGELLHKRGFRAAVNKAPMRQNMAALFLRQCGYRGDEPVYDPMCGSGTFVIEAAEVAAKLNPGRGREFAFEKLRTFDAQVWDAMKSVKRDAQTDVKCYGSDRDAGAVKMSMDNAKRAGVDHMTDFQQRVISDIEPPCDTPGLVIINPPYGKRIGETQKLLPLYQTMGKVLKERFSGWRVGIITTDKALAGATGLPFLPPVVPVQHGGLRVTLFQTDILV
jgi:putative N6-adenine-specific DNA methylase